MFIDALQSQLYLIKYWKSPASNSEAVEISNEEKGNEGIGGGHLGPRDAKNEMIGMLTSCEPYFMSKELCEILMLSAATLPPTVRPVDINIPPGFGYLFFEKSLKFMQSEKSAGFKAMAWANIDTEEHRGEIYFMFFHEDINHPLLPRLAFDYTWPELEEVKVPDELFDGIGENDYDDKGNPIMSPGASQRLRRIALSVFLLINEKIAMSEILKPARAQRRQILRKNPDANISINVIHLRRTETRPSKNDEPGYVAWKNRWLVRPHWRNQFYPSLNIHMPKLISAYVKGPENKPLKVQPVTIYSVDR